MDNVESTKRYFDKNVARLRRVKETQQSEIVRATALALKGKLAGKVLDIGSGGRIDYSLDNVDKLVSLDISAQALASAGKDDKIELIPGDARNLSLADNLFTRVVILHTIHHLAGDSVAATHKNVVACCQEAYRVLQAAGRVLLIDAVCPRPVHGVENLLFRPAFLFLRRWDKPMVYYFSLAALIAILSKVGFKEVTFSCLATANAKFCPFTSSRGIPFR